MPNTYINDNALSNYPFAYWAKLPFPRDCIAGIGVCISAVSTSSRVNFPDIIPYIGSVELADYGASVVLAANILESSGVGEEPVSSDRILGVITSRAGVAGTLNYVCSNFAVSAWMLSGKGTARYRGSYAGVFYIEPSCINVAGKSMCGDIGFVKVNGIRHDLDAVLDISTFGYAHMSTDSMPTAIDVGEEVPLNFFTGNLDAAARTTAGDYMAADYLKVTAINGLSTTPATGSGTTLRVVASDAAISVEAVNGEAPSALDIGNNDTYGDGILLHIHGDEGVPSCYAREKDNADNIVE